MSDQNNVQAGLSEMLHQPVSIDLSASRDEASSQPVNTATSPTPALLKQFSEAFDARLRPIIAPLREASDRLGAGAVELPARTLLPRLHDLSHQVQALIDRVAQQEAYVLIFGPLKSGKSTFMNALCASYVSEVTALPAYPCLVHVRHAAEAGFQVTRYDGHAETYPDQQSLHQAVAQGHRRLTDAIRRTEASGRDFEPAADMPAAIRKIDVNLPTEELARSGAVLVDTPGLYSRMKFGYDQMTRDFRDAAACAIFIVKTDNLFLEQVFAEFHQLLELFSRIFLVVNLDTNKQDLQPDGTLAPSLENAQPQRIIDAFESLSMSAPLKAAAEEGRLGIYPVDLLSAASTRMQRAARSLDADAPEARLASLAAAQADENPANAHAASVDADVSEVTEDSTTAADASEPVIEDENTAGRDEAAGEPAEDFEHLMADLTEFLNSSDYLRAFVADSMRRADGLIAEINDVGQDQSLTALAEHLDALRTKQRRLQGQLEAASRLRRIDWRAQGEALADALRSHVRQDARELREQAAQTLHDAVDEWFQTDASLFQLNEHRTAPIVDQSHARMRELVGERLREKTSGTTGGLTLSAGVMRDLLAADLPLESHVRNAGRAGADQPARDAMQVKLVTGLIPVRRRIWDWLLFRSTPRIRERLFGPGDRPTRTIAPRDKARRLGNPARTAMQNLAASQFELVIDQLLEQLPDRAFDAYITNLSQSLSTAARQREAETAATLATLTRQIDQAQRIQDVLENLRTAAEQAHLDMLDIHDRFDELCAAAPTDAADSQIEDEGAEEPVISPSATDPQFAGMEGDTAAAVTPRISAAEHQRERAS